MPSRGLPCVVCGEATTSTKAPSRGYVAHQACSDSRPFEHGVPSSYRHRGCRCEDCRRAWNEDCANRRRAARERGWRRASFVGRSCDECGALLRSKGGAKDGLSLCIQHRREKTDRDRQLAARRRALKVKVAKIAQGTAGNPRWPFIQGECDECGVYFVRKGAASPFCSKACSAARRKSWISRRDRLAIYDRDGWMCQICHGAVPRDVPITSDWSATLDHIVPRSRGGTDDADNLRTAHRWCNSVRGDLSHYTDADLQVTA